MSGEPGETLRSFVLLKDTWELSNLSLPATDAFLHRKLRLPQDAAGFLALLGARENGPPVAGGRVCSFHVVQGALVISLVLQVVSHIFQKAKAAYCQQRELEGRGKGLEPQASTLVSKFQQSLQDLTAKLRRWEMLLRCRSCTGLFTAPRSAWSLPRSAQRGVRSNVLHSLWQEPCLLHSVHHP